VAGNGPHLVTTISRERVVVRELVVIDGSRVHERDETQGARHLQPEDVAQV